MEITTLREGNTVTIKPSGRLDTNTSVDLEKAVKEALPDTENLIFDFEELNYISSAGFRVLLATRNNNEGTLNLKIQHLQEEVAELFEVTGFIDIFTIE